MRLRPGEVLAILFGLCVSLVGFLMTMLLVLFPRAFTDDPTRATTYILIGALLTLGGFLLILASSYIAQKANAREERLEKLMATLGMLRFQNIWPTMVSSAPRVETFVVLKDEESVQQAPLDVAEARDF